MKLPVSLLILFACVLLSEAAAAWTVQGTVENSDGQPLADVEVSTGRGTVVGTARTGADGSYSITVGETRTATLRFAADGYYPFLQTLSALEYRAGGTTRLPTVQLVARAASRRLFLFAGDTMMGRRFESPRADEPVLIRPETRSADMQAVLRYARPYLELADLTSVNLETQLSALPLTESLPKSVSFYTHTDIASVLAAAGVDYVALGNNHTWDYLATGLERTLEALRAAGLTFSGAGLNEASAREPAVQMLNGAEVAWLSYVGWPGRFTPSQVAEGGKGGAAYGTAAAIAEDLEALDPAALAVVQYHSGLEYVSRPGLAEETQLKRAVERGADLAIGHHSHVLQGLEVYRDRLIAWSLGNFVFDQYLPATHASMLVYAWYDGDQLYRAEIVPMHNNGYVPTPATDTMRFDILQRLTYLSRSESTCVGRSGGHLLITACGNVAQHLPEQQVDARGQRSIVSLMLLGMDPVAPVTAVLADGPYRVGLDRLRRGEFEYVGLFGTTDRSWIADPAVQVAGDANRYLEVRAGAGETIRTGMRVFTRVFQRAAPATLAFTVRSDRCADIAVALQRRRDGEGFESELTNGPVVPIGNIRTTAGEQSVSLDLQLPRTATRAIRLLIDVTGCGNDTAVVELDSLALIEWQTPWLDPDRDVWQSSDSQATHLQIAGR